MRILLLVNSHLPAIGGRELVVHNLAIQYLKAGHSVTVAGMAGVWSDRHIKFEYPVSRWPVLSLWPLAGRFVAAVTHALTHRYDVVHAHATFPIGYVAGKLRWIFRAPLVITPHGEDINTVAEIGYGQRLDPVQKPRIEWTVKVADANTAISETVHASLLDAGARQDRIFAIGNGVDLNRFDRIAPEGVTERFGLEGDMRLVVTIGNYRDLKGHEFLVESVARARELGAPIGLVVVGRTSEPFCQEVLRRGYGSFVRFAGVLPIPGYNFSIGDPLADLLAAASIYVSSSIDDGAEGLSLSLLEAMAARACPLVTNISGNKDVVQDDYNGRVVPPRDTEAMALALLELANDEGKRTRLAEQARLTAEEYSWTAVAAKYLQLYGSLIETRKSRSLSSV